MSSRLLFLVTVALLLPFVPVASACSVCFGKSDSALAQGMNMGIFSLLGVIGFVLVTIAGFFVYLARRSAQLRRMGMGESQFQETTTLS